MRQQLPPIQDMGFTIYTAHSGVVRADELPAANKRRKEREAQLLIQERQQAEKAPKGVCPFSTATNAICRSDCALLTAGKCALRREAVADTAGRRCPFTRTKCAEHCALFCGGCSLTTLFKGMKPGKD